MRIPVLLSLLILSLALGLARADADLAPKPSYLDISTAELQQLIREKEELVLIDVRTPDELELVGGSIDAPGNQIIPRGWLELRIETSVPERDTPVVVYCGLGVRSPFAARTLVELGYRQVYNYTDGALRWRDEGLPMLVPDRALDSILYAKPQQVADGVWSAIGATAPPTYANSGHNNNLSFIITNDGVVVVNAGDNYLLARALHNEIRAITEQPVRYVVLENGQGHAMLGANYWQEQGVPVIAHIDAAEEIRNHGAEELAQMRRGRRDKALDTELTEPDLTFEEELILELGGEQIELRYLGPAHSPGDIVVWLPQRRLLIAGDMAFYQRMLPIFEHTDTAAWLETWEEMVALEPAIIIPGHGEPTDLAQVTAATYDYLAYLREEIGALIDEGGSLQEAYDIDQSPFRHLHTFRELSRRNAERLFRQMEFEW